MNFCLKAFLLGLALMALGARTSGVLFTAGLVVMLAAPALLVVMALGSVMTRR